MWRRVAARMSERWQKVEELFHAALERAPEGRAAFLDGACGGDHYLRVEVESLLAREQQVDSFLEAPVLQETAVPSREVLMGREFGSYRILSLLGAARLGTRLGRPNQTPASTIGTKSGMMQVLFFKP
jgi:eukaryotic-like serine/threonine-protein kinase